MSWLPVTWLSWAETFSAQAACFLISKRNVLIEQDPKVPLSLPQHALKRLWKVSEAFLAVLPSCCLFLAEGSSF